MTDGKTSRPAELEAFERLLESYGSDRTRWPAPQRLEFAALIASNPEAQRLYREAETLDRLLDFAPTSTSDRSAVVERISAAAFTAEMAPRGLTAGRAMTARILARGSVMRHVSWPAASVLAASLVLGAVAGFSGFLDRAMAPIVSASFEDGTSDFDVGLLAFDGSTFPASEEDLL